MATRKATSNTDASILKSAQNPVQNLTKRNAHNGKKIALDIENLTKIYEDGNFKAVDSVTFQVLEGEIFSFLGPNGAGKSTTISMAATSLKPTSGNVKIFGYDILSQTKEVRKHIGICPQDLVYYENLTVYENVVFFGKMHNVPKDALREKADELIEHLGLEDKRNTLAHKLSGGMKRRLNLMIALVNEPDLIFLDEPTAGLDPQTRHLVWDYIRLLKKRGKTIFLTTHYMDEADALSDMVAIIDHGKIIALDSPFDLKSQYSSGDLIELKFHQSADDVKHAVERLVSNSNSNYKDAYYLEEDDLMRISIHDGLQNIGKLIDQLNEMGMTIKDMNVRSNSLENVFITLTGRSLRE